MRAAAEFFRIGMGEVAHNVAGSGMRVIDIAGDIIDGNFLAVFFVEEMTGTSFLGFGARHDHVIHRQTSGDFLINNILDPLFLLVGHLAWKRKIKAQTLGGNVRTFLLNAVLVGFFIENIVQGLMQEMGSGMITHNDRIVRIGKTTFELLFGAGAGKGLVSLN